MSRVSRRPTRLASALAVLAGLASVAGSGWFSWFGLAVGAVGLAVLLVGLSRSSRRLVTVGAAGLALAGLVAALRGVGPGSVLLGVTAAVIAWDAGRTAIGLGQQLTRGATTVRIEALHVGASVVVGLGSAGVGYSVHGIAPGTDSPAVLVFILAGVGLLLAALTHSSVGT